MTGTLYIVATPIGNLSDMTSRAVEVLGKVSLIAAEDTRHTGRLLSHLMLKTPLFALHDHNEEAALETVITRLKDGGDVALVSDAGTPLISDPGYRLVAAAHEHSIPVSPIPGASSVIAAMSVAGLPSDRFCFEGFLPAKSAARRQRIEQLATESRSLIFFEARHRIGALLSDLAELFGGKRQACIVREATKLHEQVLRRSLDELASMAGSPELPDKGEFVVVVRGAPPQETESTAADALLIALSGRLPPKEVAEVAAKVYGGRRNEFYRRLLDLSPNSD